ncbi:MAG: acyl-CoA dehydrogenase, partial [Pseudomonas sp. PGPPP3]
MPHRFDPASSPQHRELMDAASRIGMALSSRSAEIEAHRWLPQDIADSLAEAGLYRMLTPKVHGGHEVPPGSFYRVVEQLARGDAAAAWCCFISCTSSVLAAYLPQDEAAALFGARPHLKAAGVFAPRGRAVPAVQNGVTGLQVSGRWAWGSGVRNADIVSAGCLLMGEDGKPALLDDGAPGAANAVAIAKARAGQPLDALETLASQWLLEHPEYDPELADADAAIARVY